MDTTNGATGRRVSSSGSPRPRQILAISGTKQRKAHIVTQKPGKLPNQVTTERLFYNLATGKLELVQTTVKGQ